MSNGFEPKLCVRCSGFMTSTNPRAMYCGQKCKKDAFHARKSGKPVRKVTTTGITPAVRGTGARRVVD